MGFGVVQRVFLLPVALLTCGGRLASQQPDTMVDGSGSEMDSVPDSGAAADKEDAAGVEGTTKVAKPCPPACTGGCSGGTCVIACDTLSACGSSRIACPPGWPC